MSDFNRLLLDAFPEAALLVRQGRIAAANPLALHYLPQLEEGTPLPAVLLPPREAPDGMGSFSIGPSRYTVSHRSLEDGDSLVLFRPAPQSALTDGQLDGTIRQMRQLMNDFLMALELAGDDLPPTLPKTYYRMFRLLNNLDYMRSASGQAVTFRPVTLDLAGLCRQLTDQAATLLRDCQVTLEFISPLSSLLIPGDPELLRRMLLELISNSARAIGKGTIRLTLHSQGGRALLALSDGGTPPTRRQLAAMAQQDSDQNIPAPGAGAGLGLTIARDIVNLHGGSLLVGWDPSAPTTVFLSLPAGPSDARLPVESPTSGVLANGGLSPLLVGLADVLPARLFHLNDLD